MTETMSLKCTGNLELEQLLGGEKLNSRMVASFRKKLEKLKQG